MKNIFDIKKEKNLNIILPKDIQIGKVNYENNKCVILIHLYYIDTVEQYLPYIEKLPKEVDLYFTYSEENLKEKIENLLKQTQIKCSFIKKKNRGRDISALLVAARTLLKRYKFVCFLHDKKVNNPMRKEDNSNWNYSLWENMIGSRQYVENVLYTFQNNNTLGLLVPPPLVSDRMDHAYKNQWLNNYKTTKKIINELKINCDLDKNMTPITLGTVFWARTEALRKLFEKKWTYEDFDEEPLLDDGTISHAIERVFAYVAKDAGFNTGWVMTDKYAGEYIEKMQAGLKKTMHVLDEELGMKYIAEINFYKEKRLKLKAFAKKNKRIYIYGAGEYGQSCYKLLRSISQESSGFIVSKKTKGNEKINKLKVFSIDELEFSKEDGIIVAVNYKLQDEILEELQKKKNIKERIFIFDRLGE